MTRVLNIISDTNLGGAGRVLLNYLRYSDRARFETLAAVPPGSALKALLLETGIPVLEAEGIADRSYSARGVRALERLIRQVEPDLVHTHGALSGRIAARRCHVPVVYTRHSVFPVPARLRYPPGRWANRWINEHYAQRIIAVSPAARDNLIQAGVSPGKITVVMNGTAPVEAVSPQARQALRRELGLEPGVVAFGILARLEDYKGHLDLVEAARLLKGRGRTGFRVLIAGTGPFEGELLRAVEKTGTADVVHLLGFRSDVGELLNALDVQLNASYGTEATSMALLEGMSLGLPSVVSDYGGNPFLIRHGDNGLVFPARDAAALSRAMERLMDDPPLREELGCRAREDFRRRFTGEVFARGIEQVYDDILKGV